MSYSMSDGYESRQQSDDDTNGSSRNGWDEDCDESTFDRTNEEFDFEENNASDIESHKDLPRGYDNEYGDRFLTADDSPLRASRNAMLLKSPSTRSTQRHLAIQQHYDQQRQTSDDDDDDGDELPSVSLNVLHKREFRSPGTSFPGLTKRERLNVDHIFF
ncbi:MAG: hypothetical protein J3R72DRAFT_12102 [Linnemannia gamsii]|nr:MAG: hypothetical protein J3R72DRAFT_12102 [Linnemannia gamsii]